MEKQATPIRIEPNAIQKKAGISRKFASGGETFGSVMSTFAPAMSEFMYQGTGSSTAASVLHAAFSAFPGAAGGNQFGGATGLNSYGTGATGFGAYSESPGVMGTGKYASGLSTTNSTEIAGLEGSGLSQAELINTMNVNNLKLLELQAVMQNNMQAWNTKSNILSADHRARMAMIEKFTARG